MVIFEALYVKTGNKQYEILTRFWLKIFAITFGIGVATGIIMEFEFGTNCAVYSRYVGDIFGSALAAEGLFAFGLESTFLGILLFGWNRVSPKVHLFSTVMVFLGSMFSAVWIVVANSWQQTPAGYHIVGEGSDARAEVTDFWAMVFNPSRLSLFMTQGAIFLLLKTEGRLHTRLTFLLKKGMLFFITSFAVTSLYTLLFLPGVTDKFKEYPVFFVLPLLAFLAVANVPRLVSKKKYAQALIFSSLTMAFLLMLVAFQLYPVLLPSTIDPEHSVTIYNAASSQKSLGIMLTMVVIGAPLLMGYLIFLYKTFNGKVMLDDTSY